MNNQAALTTASAVLVDGTPVQSDAFDALAWHFWQGNFTVNCVMQGLWGLHNLHQWIIIMRGADKGTETEWRRPYPMFLWSLLGACGTGFVRNLIILMNGQVNDTITWITGIYEVTCLLLIVADLLYFIIFEHSCGMNKAEDYGKDDWAFLPIPRHRRRCMYL